MRGGLGLSLDLQLLVNVGVDYVTSEDIVLKGVTETPPRRQLYVDLIASLHVQHDNLKAHTGAITKSVNKKFDLQFKCQIVEFACGKHVCTHASFTLV